MTAQSKPSTNAKIWVRVFVASITPATPRERIHMEPLLANELAAYEAERDLAAELLQAVQEMKAGQVHVVSSSVIDVHKIPGNDAPHSTSPSRP